ncbi:B3/4 domain-containing protein [Leuconostoc citreum]|uniref:B3/B4 domain-containing protein n=1 Tax=Leuconostoc citreum TaxID=33964 RepID=UPI0020A1CB6B|nr:phenylalanine--tRNA ligase beta subunit-related protein [Leuconostoc citreum]MCP1275640.1 phenylalanine--tRNA ligase beta subunit-related protein [Leuconostoc citreum]
MNYKVAPFIPEQIKLAIVEIEFTNSQFNERLWEEQLNPLISKINVEDTLETIRENPVIQTTKNLYKELGKDPARFRPSSDSLWRRVAKGSGLYQVNTLVDLNNFLSLKYHLPFGSYDLNNLQQPILLKKGSQNEQYAGIGKKMINLENLLLLADAKGPFGSPTSDSTRAMISQETTKAIIVAYLFDTSSEVVEQINQDIEELVPKYLNNAHIIK